MRPRISSTTMCRSRPTPRSLAIAQDRFLEKSFIAELGIATAGFRNVGNEVEASTACRALERGCPAVLKTRGSVTTARASGS